jgi:folate-binding protein YgfZ
MPSSKSSSESSLQYRAIKATAGMRVLDDRLIVRVSGDDRVSFMHGMCTADVKRLEPGGLVPALFVTEHAHVIADCFIYALDEALWIEMERSRWPRVRDHLEKLLVADDVELDELESLAILDLEGPASSEIVVAAFGSGTGQLKPWQHLGLGVLRIAHLPRYAGPAFSIITERAAMVAAIEQVKKVRSDIPEVTAEALEMVRIEKGLALPGVDTGERTLALEARLERAISFNKGCYLGQETIERATAHGALKRRLCGLRIAGNANPRAGAMIRFDGKDIGRLTSLAHSPDAGVIALAILHHSVWSPGTQVSIQDESGAIEASVDELPFAGKSGLK